MADVSIRAFVQARATERAQAEAPPGATVSTSVGGFPFVPSLLFAGSVSQVGVHLENVKAAPLVFGSVDVELRGVKLDRGMLLQERRVKIVDIDSGSIDVVITQGALSDALNVPVSIAGGAVSVTILQRSFAVTPSITPEGRLSLTGAAGRTLTLSLPKLDYVPCFGEITVLAGRLRFSCAITEVPPALVDAVADAS